MSNKQKQLNEEIVISFMFGKLGPEEEDAFLNFLDVNPEYRESVDNLMEMCVSENISEADFRAYLNRLDPFKALDRNEAKDVSRTIRPFSKVQRFFPALAAAAAVILLLVMFLWPQRPDEFAGYPKIRPENKQIAVLKGNGDAIPEKAVVLYDTGNFKDFLEYPFTEAQARLADLQFFIALAALQQSPIDLELAKRNLEYARENNTYYKVDVLYYLAQVALFQRRPDECAEILKELQFQSPGYPGLDELKELCQES